MSLAACVWVSTVLALAPSPAVAQQRDPTPSARELWREYPLEATPEARVRPTAEPPSRAPVGRGERRPRPAEGGGGPGVLVLIAAGIAAAGSLVALAWIGRRRRRAGALPRAGERPGTRFAAPPDVALAWTAEIEWHQEPGGSRFRIMATAGSPERTAVSESEPLEWPPTGPDSLRALRDAVDELEAGAVAAGWRPVAAGRAWYAKRFTWQPAPAAASTAPGQTAPSAPPPGTGRFKRRTAWPQGTGDRP